MRSIASYFKNMNLKELVSIYCKMFMSYNFDVEYIESEKVIEFLSEVILEDIKHSKKELIQEILSREEFISELKLVDAQLDLLEKINIILLEKVMIYLAIIFSGWGNTSKSPYINYFSKVNGRIESEIENVLKDRENSEKMNEIYLSRMRRKAFYNNV